MDLVNETGMEAGWMVSRIDPPASALTVLVKGTFKLCHQGTANLLPRQEQRSATGDEFDESSGAKVLRYASDFAPLKPRTDVLVSGDGYAPNGVPVGAFNASFRIGPCTKSVTVIGDRFWNGRISTEPSAINRMPLGWNKALGGVGFEQNPVGKGFKPVTREDGSIIHALPNIESPGHLISDRHDHPAPAGFGPVPEDWPQRRKKFGKFTARYLKERWPGFPENMDWGFFNSAPEDQQLDGYLRGDEELFFENLHPTIAQFRTRLPGLRVRAFLNELVRAHDELREIPLRLDTLWVQPDTEQLILVWRGHAAVRKEKLTGVYHLLLACEPLSTPLAPLGHFNTVLQDALDRRDAEDEELEPETEPDETEDADAAEPSEDVGVTEVEAGEAGDEAADPQRANPANAASPADDTELEPEGDVSEAPEEDIPDTDDALTLEQIRDKLSRSESFDNCDLSGQMLADLDFSGVSLREAILERAILIRANLAQADFSGALLGGADLRQVKGAGAIFAGADLTGALLSEANLAGADLRATDFTRARLRGANLAGVQAAESIFEEADLSEANLQGADLTAADLCQARVHRTDVSGANLTDAAMEGAWGRQFQARGAILRKLRAAGARLSGANFEGVQAEDSVWQSAQLHAADFKRARLDTAEFSSSYLGEANFDSAEMKYACLNEANLVRARLHRANLLSASLEKSILTGTSFTESNLYGATLMDAHLERTSWNGANLRRVKTKETLT